MPHYAPPSPAGRFVSGRPRSLLTQPRTTVLATLTHRFANAFSASWNQSLTEWSLFCILACMKTKTNVKAGGLWLNHASSQMVRTGVRAGLGSHNHNSHALKTKTNTKAGGRVWNHNQSGLSLRTKVQAGGLRLNHSQSGIAVQTDVKAGGFGVRK